MWLLRNWRIAASLAVLFFAFAAGWKFQAALCDSRINKMKIDSANASAQENLKKLREAEEYEKQRRERQRKRNELIAEVSHETSKAAYTDCIVPTDGVRLVNRAVESGAQADSPGESGKSL